MDHPIRSAPVDAGGLRDGTQGGAGKGAPTRLRAGIRRWIRIAISEMRRTRRVIVTPDTRPTGEPPIFLVGVHRSGTTLLRLIVDSHSRIACPPESFFVAPLEGVLRDEKAREGLEAMGFETRQVLDKLRETASWFFEMYAATRGKARWADKTPSYVDCLDFLDALFGPDARYVMIYRNGLDVACSSPIGAIREVVPHVEACGGNVHAGAARYWAHQCEKMLAFQAAHPGQCHELRYEALASDPEPEVRKLFAFLGEDFEPEVLRFHEKPHDQWIGLEDTKAARSKGFKPAIGGYRNQPADVVEAMRAQCGPMLERLGYAEAMAPGGTPDPADPGT